MIKRLRPAYSEEELKEIYAVPHRHDIFEDHVIRVNQTIELAKELLGDTSGLTAADLSCGDATTVKSLGFERYYLGDYAPGYDLCGPIEQTILEIPEVDVFFLCETLEHLDDPVWVLRAIRNKADFLILSTPLNEQNDENPEHYWGWDTDGIRDTLVASYWKPSLYRQTELRSGWYQFQIWGCD